MHYTVYSYYSAMGRSNLLSIYVCCNNHYKIKKSRLKESSITLLNKIGTSCILVVFKITMTNLFLFVKKY